MTRNIDVDESLVDAERAARAGDDDAAVQRFLDAGDNAKRYQLWQTAVRCYRGALEIDLIDRVAIARLIEVAARARAGTQWHDYARALDGLDLPRFGCRNAQIVTGDSRTYIDCARVGAVLDISMPADDLVEARPDRRFAAMPIGMAMIIVRRALWPGSAKPTGAPRSVRIGFAGHRHAKLDDLGDWELT